MVTTDVSYVVSQIFTIITYILLAITYFSKNKKSVLFIGNLSTIANIIAYVLLNAYTGVAMCVLAIFRNIIILIIENNKNKITRKTNYLIKFAIYAVIIILAVYTYNGLPSLLSVVATIIYTHSVWQKKTSVYKMLGIPNGVLWLLYNIYINSLFGIILESVLLVCTILGYKKENNTNKK